MSHHNLSILVSKPIIDAHLTAQGLTAPDDKDAAIRLLLKSSGVRSQGEFAGLVVTLLKGQITPDELTALLTEAFPGDRVSKRHGGHYLSHCRTGKIVVPEDCIPGKGVRKAAATVVVQDTSKIDALEAKYGELVKALAAADDKLSKIAAAKNIKEIKALIATEIENEE